MLTVELHSRMMKPKSGASLAFIDHRIGVAARCDMTTPDTTATTSQVEDRFQLPDPPRREPDEMTQYGRLFKTGNSRYLALHLGSPETTLVEADRWIVPDPSFNRSRPRRPDLLVAFGVDPTLYQANNGYIISEQGKPPDLVLEVASESTADVDVGAKRRDYEDLGIGEYWRFDHTATGEFHGVRLAGDRLIEGAYVPIEIEELPSGSLQGYSLALNLYLRWEQGELVFCEPATGEQIDTFESERSARLNATPNAPALTKPRREYGSWRAC